MAVTLVISWIMLTTMGVCQVEKMADSGLHMNKQ